ncbi:MAG: excinuclease ABC subunit UvrB [Christensenellales bacterium]|jgi:excinuclease ABC subunit B|nr:excinuclease ABC subunit UvrB [Clostridiales bacterium]
MDKFQLSSNYKPQGDQPQAIEKLVQGLLDGFRVQVLLGVTGSGKTFTMANVIQKINKPTLIIAHNKTLAAQLCNELRELFPKNRVEYFVSYYDYYKPEAYIPSTDTYIAKDLSMNDEIDKLRHSATASLGERRDVIVVSSVSCIYGLGAPQEYFKNMISLRPEMKIDRDELIDRLVALQYRRSDIDFARSTFRARGDILEIFPSNYSNLAIRVEFFGDTVERLSEFDITTGKEANILEHAAIFPASHYVVGEEGLESILARIKKDMEKEVEAFKKKNKLLEAQRLLERVSYDIEMIREIGYCNGIENYSRYFDGRKTGEPPFTLLDYFPDDFLLFIDESHMTLPQIRAMYNGDKARKDNLVNYGFRLKAAYDNRPLNFQEFTQRFTQLICVSATPGEYEMEQQSQVVEQLIRPTGLVDPEVFVRKTKGQIDDLISEIYMAMEKDGRTLVTTLTKRMAESLTAYLKEHKIKVSYMHSDIDTLERVDIISSLRRGEIDVLVGINLLREGLDLPEVALVAILDADKEGFLRSRSSLIQTIGRAARNSQSKVIMYADTITDSMKAAIEETNRRREYQIAYNKKHNITPKTIKKDIVNTLMISRKIKDADRKKLSRGEIIKEIERLTGLMSVASHNLDFETCIQLRDEIMRLKKEIRQ